MHKGTARRLLAGFAAMAVLLALAACQRGNDAAPARDYAADEAAIRSLLDRIAADFNAGKMEDMLGHYLDDVLVSAPGAPDITSKQAWRETLAATLPPGLAMTLKFVTAEVAIDGDLAYERGTYEINVADQANPAAAFQIKGRHVHIFKRQTDGSWKGWRLMENSEDPATNPVPPPPAATGGQIRP
jgi:ketosteroid isomerase-like protein